MGCTHNFFKVRLGGNPTKYDDGSLLSKELLGNTRKVYKKFLKFLRSIRREAISQWGNYNMFNVYIENSLVIRNLRIVMKRDFVRGWSSYPRIIPFAKK